MVPVYNEEHLVYSSLKRLRVLETSDLLERIEVIVVDDGSTDLLRIVQVFVDEEVDAVYGSRFAGGERRRVLLYRHAHPALPCD